MNSVKKCLYLTAFLKVKWNEFLYDYFFTYIFAHFPGCLFHFTTIIQERLAFTCKYLFYSWGAPKFIFLLLTTTLIDFINVRKMDRCEKQQIRKRYMWLAIGINLGVLIYFKYANFFIESINSGLVELGITPIPWLEIAFPVGISFTLLKQSHTL